MSTHTHSFPSSNRTHWDNVAPDLDASHWGKVGIAITNKLVPKMLERVHFGPNTQVLDFACGTGTVSRALEKHGKLFVGVDISSGMVDAFNSGAEAAGFSHKLKAECIDLQGKEGELDGAKFDVIFCSMAYHHLPSIKETTKILAYFLKPRGHLLVIDSAKDSMIINKYYANIISMNGVSEDEIREAFEGAGLSLESYEHAASLTKDVDGADMKICLSVGAKVEKTV